MSRRERAIALGIGAGLLAIGFALGSLTPRGPERSPSGMAQGPGQAPAPPPVHGDAMTLGIEALYTKQDPVSAAARFREVLAQNPEHYGASFQLATALDRAGNPREAKPVWEKVSKMAQAIGDTGTAEWARTRLAELNKVARVEGEEATEAMNRGLEALYTKRDPAGAVVHFRNVLARNPQHYGATFQLATALDQAGKPAEARPVWTNVLKMAEAIQDVPTIQAARARLSRQP